MVALHHWLEEQWRPWAHLKVATATTAAARTPAAAATATVTAGPSASPPCSRRPGCCDGAVVGGGVGDGGGAGVAEDGASTGEGVVRRVGFFAAKVARCLGVRARAGGEDGAGAAPVERVRGAGGAVERGRAAAAAGRSVDPGLGSRDVDAAAARAAAVVDGPAAALLSPPPPGPSLPPAAALVELACVVATGPRGLLLAVAVVGAVVGAEVGAVVGAAVGLPVVAAAAVAAEVAAAASVAVAAAAAVVVRAAVAVVLAAAAVVAAPIPAPAAVGRTTEPCVGSCEVAAPAVVVVLQDDAGAGRRVKRFVTYTRATHGAPVTA